MRLNFLQEPELELGTGRHVDIRLGLMNYGPLDNEHPLAPREIKLGIVGTPETVEGVLGWLERCRSEIPAKPSRQPNLFPKFPGFNDEVGFHSSLGGVQVICQSKPAFCRTLSRNRFPRNTRASNLKIHLSPKIPFLIVFCSEQYESK